RIAQFINIDEDVIAAGNCRIEVAEYLLVRPTLPQRLHQVAQDNNGKYANQDQQRREPFEAAKMPEEVRQNKPNDETQADADSAAESQPDQEPARLHAKSVTESLQAVGH